MAAFRTVTTVEVVEPFLLVSDVCKRLNVSAPTCYRLMNSGQLAYVVVGRGRRVRPADLEAMIEKNTVRRAGA